MSELELIVSARFYSREALAILAEALREPYPSLKVIDYQFICVKDPGARRVVDELRDVLYKIAPKLNELAPKFEFKLVVIPTEGEAVTFTIYGGEVDASDGVVPPEQWDAELERLDRATPLGERQPVIPVSPEGIIDLNKLLPITAPAPAGYQWVARMTHYQDAPAERRQKLTIELFLERQEPPGVSP